MSFNCEIFVIFSSRATVASPIPNFLPAKLYLETLLSKF